ncbi:mandelate racemase/muconate lactonizing enzyme family protein [Arthrobacter sp. B10-11]|uniref:mandelate racemase/muconate lactonizing enzyme family protein n=1 Tax=Arthrobacter sp. B10-11 TaxID=3081160 RepID=UPI002952E773|nr:enolase C-terminal domain-like protein [Arthrobacter sp. B10-11]MDV8146430.1 enolase C-terminal domain-like protein [Arthrobacter sp. B10-11]
MKITAIEAIPFAIPYTKPLRFASGEVHTALHVLVRVSSDDGIVGVAEAPARPFTYGETQESIVAAIRTLFAPRITGMSVMDREAIHAILDRTVGNPTAKSALDMALWDVIGKTLGQPVTALLGGFSDSMRVSHMLGFAEPAKMVAEAERMRDTYGITTFKVKVGRKPFKLDVDVCRALREELGADIELYIDGNRGWTPSESLRALNAMADIDLTLAEELCPADDVLGRKWLVEQCTVPFVADESATTPGEVTRALLGGAANAVSIKTARTGFSHSQRVLFQCDGLGAEVVMGNQIDGQLGTLCTVTFGAAYKSTTQRAGELSNFLDMSDDLLAEPLEIVDGKLFARQTPGIGIEIDAGKLAKYRLDDGN